MNKEKTRILSRNSTERIFLQYSQYSLFNAKGRQRRMSTEEKSKKMKYNITAPHRMHHANLCYVRYLRYVVIQAKAEVCVNEKRSIFIEKTRVYC